MVTKLVIGLGNPILGDDAVGWVVVRKVQEEIHDRSDLEFDYLSLGGLSLMERLVGYKQVVLVDSFLDKDLQPGQVLFGKLDTFIEKTAGHSTSAHDTSLQNALKLGRKINIDLPDDQEISVVAIVSQKVYDFTEELTPAILEAVPKAVNLVKKFID